MNEYELKLAQHLIYMKEVWYKKLGTKYHDIAVIEMEKYQQDLESLIYSVKNN